METELVSGELKPFNIASFHYPLTAEPLVKWSLRSAVQTLAMAILKT